MPKWNTTSRGEYMHAREVRASARMKIRMADS